MSKEEMKKLVNLAERDVEQFWKIAKPAGNIADDYVYHAMRKILNVVNGLVNDKVE